MPRRPLALRIQAFLSVVGVLVMVVAAGSALVVVFLRQELERQYEQRALAVARAVAADPDIVSGVLTGDSAGVQARAEAVRRHTAALFVVVTDLRGVRLSHPNPDRIGQLVSTDPSEALAGRENTALETGTLGLSARGKVPLRSTDGQVRGEVSVGIAADEVSARTVSLLRVAALFAGSALLLGAMAAGLFARRLKRQTLGLEPADLSELLREREAVLRGVSDGVLAVDPAGRVTVCTAEAVRLLGVTPDAGAPVADLGLPERLTRLLLAGRAVAGEVVVVGAEAVVVTGRPVRRGRRDLGYVMTVRDRSRLDDLSREMDALQALSDALRAQSHEYTNRLHVLSGMLQLGDTDGALRYLRELASDPLAADTEDIDRIRDPYLRGLLVAKRAVAGEQGVELRLVPDSRVPGRLSAPLAVVTVLGNLVDNAVRSAAEGPRRPAVVDVSLIPEGQDLLLAVADSGTGVPAELAERVFDDGVTTRENPDGRHGIGLALARQVARSHGGDVVLDDRGGADHGALFAARLTGLVPDAALVRGAGE